MLCAWMGCGSPALGHGRAVLPFSCVAKSEGRLKWVAMGSESVRRLSKGWAVVFGFCLGAAVGWMARGIHHPVPVKEPAVTPAIATCPAQRLRAGDRFIVPFVRVVDGDTIKVNWHGEETSVRMLGIDTPERGHPGYREATRHLRKMIGPATEVQIEFETGRPQRDRYSRLLAYVWLGGKNLNVEQVRAGHSRFITRYGRGKHAEEFERAERRGLRRPKGQEAPTSTGTASPSRVR